MSDEQAGDRLLPPLSLAWSALVFVVLESIAGSGHFDLRHLFTDGDVGSASFGVLVVHGILCSDERRRILVLRAGILLEVVRYALLMRASVPLFAIVLSTGYGFLGAALVDFLLHREWRSATFAALVPVGMASTQLALGGVVEKLTPQTYDGTLLALDATLRVPFTRWAGMLFSSATAIRVLASLAYAALPGAIAVGLAYEEFARRRDLERGVGVNLLLAYLVSGMIVGFLYYLSPVTGPVHAFPSGFPASLPGPTFVPLALAPFAPGSPRNATPSMHFAWRCCYFEAAMVPEQRFALALSSSSR